jgi:hypothetical protein
MPSSRKFILAVKTWGSDEAIHSWKYLKAHILQVRLLLWSSLQTLRGALRSNCMKHPAMILSPSCPTAARDAVNLLDQGLCPVLCGLLLLQSAELQGWRHVER